jgi:hypothetical protein
MNIEYVIVGDTEKYNGCLIYTVGISYERAEQTLNRMLNNPTENDKRVMKGHVNFRIEEADKGDCWWNEM